MADTNQAPTALSPELLAFLQAPTPVLVTTIDAETGWPSNNLITWVVATEPTRLRLATETRGRVMTNIRSDARILLTVMTHGACHTVEGTAKVIADDLAGVSLKLSCAEVAIQAVRDVTFWGGKLVAEPQFDVTYDKELKAKLDTGVFKAMKELA